MRKNSALPAIAFFTAVATVYLIPIALAVAAVTVAVHFIHKLW